MLRVYPKGAHVQIPLKNKSCRGIVMLLFIWRVPSCFNRAPGLTRRDHTQSCLYLQSLDKVLGLFCDRILQAAERASVTYDDGRYFFFLDNVGKRRKEVLIVGNHAARKCDVFTRCREPDALRAVVDSEISHNNFDVLYTSGRCAASRTTRTLIPSLARSSSRWSTNSPF